MNINARLHKEITEIGKMDNQSTKSLLTLAGKKSEKNLEAWVDKEIKAMEKRDAKIEATFAKMEAMIDAENTSLNA